MQEYNYISGFFHETFRPFLLRHFCHWNISVICLKVVLKLAVKVLLTYIFRHSDRNDLSFFGHFENILVYDRKMTETKTSSIFRYWVEYH